VISDELAVIMNTFKKNRLLHLETGVLPV